MFLAICSDVCGALLTGAAGALGDDEVLPRDPGLDLALPRRQQGHDGLAHRTQHARGTGDCRRICMNLGLPNELSMNSITRKIQANLVRFRCPFSTISGEGVNTVTYNVFEGTNFFLLRIRVWGLGVASVTGCDPKLSASPPIPNVNKLNNGKEFHFPRGCSSPH